MRIRTIKPEFWANEKLSEVSESAHMLAAALLNYCDDEGYFNANQKLIKAALYPIREPSVNIHGMLIELSNIDYLRIGRGDDGRTYGYIVNFTDHQKINRPSASKIKGLADFTECSVNNHGAISEHSLPEQGTGNREQGTGNKEQGDPKPLKGATLATAKSYLQRNAIDWIPQDVWDEWCDHKKRKKCALTDRAMGMNVKTLETLGRNKSEFLLATAMNKGWKDIYEPGTFESSNSQKPQNSLREL